MKPTLLFLFLSCLCTSAYAQDRMPPIPSAQMTDAQKKAAEVMMTLIAARHWTQQFEWNAHYPLALAAGLKQEIVTAIAEGRRPSNMAEDEEIVYDFCTELNANHSVSDAMYARAVAKLGEQRVVDMVAVNGFYGMIAMLMNAARTPVVTRQAPSLAAFPH